MKEEQNREQLPGSGRAASDRENKEKCRRKDKSGSFSCVRKSTSFSHRESQTQSERFTLV